MSSSSYIYGIFIDTYCDEKVKENETPIEPHNNWQLRLYDKREASMSDE